MDYQSVVLNSIPCVSGVIFQAMMGWPMGRTEVLKPKDPPFNLTEGELETLREQMNEGHKSRFIPQRLVTSPKKLVPLTLLKTIGNKPNAVSVRRSLLKSDARDRFRLPKIQVCSVSAEM